MINAGILTISDKGARGERRDDSGTAIRDSLTALDSHVARYEVIPDEAESIAAKPKVQYQYFIQGHYPHKTCEVQNALWARLDYAPYSETYGAGTPVCMCEGAGFDVDAFGRVWYTNLFRFRVEMVDTDNNFALHFGAYGNQDSLGGGKSIPRESESAAGAKHPDVPLAWPTYVAVSDDYAYVNDTVGMRVARVRLGAEAEEVCNIQ